MELLKKITAEKFLRYLFLLLSLGGALLLLLNLNAYLNIGGSGAMIRGWVSLGGQTTAPSIMTTEFGQIKLFTMGQGIFAMLHFDSKTGLFQGLPLLFIFAQVMLEGVVVFILFQLMQVFASLDNGAVFSRYNSNRIRNIAFAALSFSLLDYGKSFLLSHIVRDSGELFKNAHTYIRIEQLGFGMLIALIILALLKAFKIGAHLQQEQDLTI